jgi:hypothetical protein
MFFDGSIVNIVNYFMEQNNQKLILKGIIIKVILIIRNNILIYLKRHYSNYVINILFITF